VSLSQVGAAYPWVRRPNGRHLAAGIEGAVESGTGRRIGPHYRAHLARTTKSTSIPVALAATATGERGRPRTGPDPLPDTAHQGGCSDPNLARASAPRLRRWSSARIAGGGTASLDRTVSLGICDGELFRHFLHTGNVLGVAFSGRPRLDSQERGQDRPVWDRRPAGKCAGLRGHTGRCGCVVNKPGRSGASRDKHRRDHPHLGTGWVWVTRSE